VSDFIIGSEAHILEKTGFKMTIVEKQHRHLLAALKERALPPLEAAPQGDGLLAGGNCIPLAISRLHRLSETCIANITNLSSAANELALRRQTRSVRDCEVLCDVSCLPSIGLPVTRDHPFMLISECRGRPHAIAVVPPALDGGDYHFFNHCQQ